MPAFLENKLLKEYGSPTTAFKIMNAIGAVRGNKITAKGRPMQRKHDQDVRAGKAK